VFILVAEKLAKPQRYCTKLRKQFL
jgi:hypothetical protein